MAVFCETQPQSLLATTMRKHGHRTSVGRWVHHHIDGETLALHVAASLRETEGILTVEGEGCRRGDVGVDRRAQHFKVVDFAQVVAGNRLREGNLDVLTDTQHTVGRFRRAERTWQTCVLDTRQDGRCVGQETARVTCIHHCPQVVVLLHGIHLTIERSHDDAVRRDGVGHTACLLAQRIVCIV